MPRSPLQKTRKSKGEVKSRFLQLSKKILIMVTLCCSPSFSSSTELKPLVVVTDQELFDKMHAEYTSRGGRQDLRGVKHRIKFAMDKHVFEKRRSKRRCREAQSVNLFPEGSKVLIKIVGEAKMGIVYYPGVVVRHISIEEQVQSAKDQAEFYSQESGEEEKTEYEDLCIVKFNNGPEEVVSTYSLQRELDIPHYYYDQNGDVIVVDPKKYGMTDKVLEKMKTGCFGTCGGGTKSAEQPKFVNQLSAGDMCYTNNVRGEVVRVLDKNMLLIDFLDKSEPKVVNTSLFKKGEHGPEQVNVVEKKICSLEHRHFQKIHDQQYDIRFTAPEEAFRNLTTHMITRKCIPMFEVEMDKPGDKKWFAHILVKKFWGHNHLLAKILAHALRCEFEHYKGKKDSEGMRPLEHLLEKGTIRGSSSLSINIMNAYWRRALQENPKSMDETMPNFSKALDEFVTLSTDPLCEDSSTGEKYDWTNAFRGYREQVGSLSREWSEYKKTKRIEYNQKEMPAEEIIKIAQKEGVVEKYAFLRDDKWHIPYTLARYNPNTKQPSLEMVRGQMEYFMTTCVQSMEEDYKNLSETNEFMWNCCVEISKLLNEYYTGNVIDLKLAMTYMKRFSVFGVYYPKLIQTHTRGKDKWSTNTFWLLQNINSATTTPRLRLAKMTECPSNGKLIPLQGISASTWEHSHVTMMRLLAHFFPGKEAEVLRKAVSKYVPRG